MQTKGVASVRSPVCNLQQHKPDILHEDFVHAVVREFQDHYDVQETVGGSLVFIRNIDAIILRSTGWMKVVIARVSRRSGKGCMN